MTSFRAPSFEMGKTGAKLLIDILNGQTPSGAPLRLPVELIPGDTLADLRR